MPERASSYENRPRATYDKHAYDVFSFEDAQRATLGDLVDNNTIIAKGADRWGSETAYTAELIARTIAPSPGETIMDYGCGAGRMSLVLVNGFRCRVIGVDQSPAMLMISEGYVRHKDYRSLYFSAVDGLGPVCDAAVCIFVLQHSICPDDDVRRLYGALKPGGRLLVVNHIGRLLPTLEHGFVDDGVNVREGLEWAFGKPVESGTLDPNRVDPRFAGVTFWSVYQK